MWPARLFILNCLRSRLCAVNWVIQLLSLSLSLSLALSEMIHVKDIFVFICHSSWAEHETHIIRSPPAPSLRIPEAHSKNPLQCVGLTVSHSRFSHAFDDIMSQVRVLSQQRPPFCPDSRNLRSQKASLFRLPTPKNVLTEADLLLKVTDNFVLSLASFVFSWYLLLLRFILLARNKGACLFVSVVTGISGPIERSEWANVWFEVVPFPCVFNVKPLAL
jgi:hypothetical protein